MDSTIATMKYIWLNGDKRGMYLNHQAQVNMYEVENTSA
jgi:hypothetical protein